MLTNNKDFISANINSMRIFLVSYLNSLEKVYDKALARIDELEGEVQALRNELKKAQCGASTLPVG